MAEGPWRAAPGWYPDPSGAPSQRYWDGAGWTQFTNPAGPGAGYGVPAGPQRPPAGGSHTGWIIAGVVAAVVVLIGGVVLAARYLPRQPGSAGGTASPASGAPSGSSSTTPRSVASSTTAAVPSTTPASAMSRLLTLLPSNLRCTSSTRVAEPGAVANADCTRGTQLTYVGYSLFPDRASLDRSFNKFDGVTLEACPGYGASPQDWHQGKLACYFVGGTGGSQSPQVHWTIDAELVEGYAWGTVGGPIDPVYQWWAAHYP